MTSRFGSATSGGKHPKSLAMAQSNMDRIATLLGMTHSCIDKMILHPEGFDELLEKLKPQEGVGPRSKKLRTGKHTFQTAQQAREGQQAHGATAEWDHTECKTLVTRVWMDLNALNSVLKRMHIRERNESEMGPDSEEEVEEIEEEEGETQLPFQQESQQEGETQWPSRAAGFIVVGPAVSGPQ